MGYGLQRLERYELQRSRSLGLREGGENDFHCLQVVICFDSSEEPFPGSRYAALLVASSSAVCMEEGRFSA